ncbi:hypothetical protein [Chryseobacterium hagamense]|uniref:Sporulation-delaying protein SdpB n=1 Tax=Chryseobacterium hagamense TaxID=395935 RepID=A0A511YQL7_9FLAO|nr:hypothetical protein [Chryseobacterium hagamense]GEN77485.1 sporulation-delaying protein SdpB [Chryseobacterium hagamense]
MKTVIEYLESKNIFNQKIIIARSLLAFGSLLLLLFNNITELTDSSLMVDNDSFSIVSPFKQYSLFNVCDPGIAKVISIIILLWVISGYLPQLSSILQTWVHFSICNSFVVIDGGDQVALILSLLLIPVCLFDKRINQWNNSRALRKNANIFFNVYFFLIYIQVAGIYLHAGIGKLYTTDEWRNGTCLYYWFTNNVFGAPVIFQNIYNFFTLSKFAPIYTWLIIIFELGLFACILATNKKIRYSFMIAGILFHLGISLTHGLITFFFSMFAALILYLDSDNIMYHYLKKIKLWITSKKTLHLGN